MNDLRPLTVLLWGTGYGLEFCRLLCVATDGYTRC